MFDIGFWEIILISVIALIVLGPERLPIAIRSVMHWINTARGMANSVKKEISQELKLYEMNEKISQVSKLGLAEIAPELQQSLNKGQQSADEISRSYENLKDNFKPTLDLMKKEKTDEYR